MPAKRHSRAASSSIQVPKRQRKDGGNDASTDTPTAKTPADFYPKAMTNTRAREYIDGTRRRPAQVLDDALEKTKSVRSRVKTSAAVVHWFRADLRLNDNRALAAASAQAAETGVPLIGLYVVSPEDWIAHATSPVRVDFVLRSLAELKTALATLDVPLWVETVERRGDVAERVAALLADWKAAHVYANREYEVDELRRDAKAVKLLADRGVAMDVLHDTCVVAPGLAHSPEGGLLTGTGKPYAVFSPWFRAWVQRLHEQPALLEASPAPKHNPETARKTFAHLFDCSVPEAPAGKQFADAQEAERMRKLWPAGEKAAAERLAAFAREHLEEYAAQRDEPAAGATSSLSVHLSSGTLSARTAVRTAQIANSTQRLDGGREGPRSWIREVAWRDFYRNVLVAWPYVGMNKPYKLELTCLDWADDPEAFSAWCEGRTGYPIVDAAMRQLLHTGWMHNRCRMVVASFLTKDLRIDWRKGEQFFMEHLVDGDNSSNSGGWGWAASVGVDPQPYFRIFSPLRQSERFDPDGTYLRTWLPELQDVPDNSRGAIHAPYERGAAAEAGAGRYPRPIVEHSAARARALAMYRGEDVKG